VKIGYFSDLHTEFMRPNTVVEANRHKSRYGASQIGLETFGKMLAEAYSKADVIVAAGDIGTREKAVHFLKESFHNKPVIYVPGNHDHWAGEYYSNLRKMTEAAEGSNVHFFHDGGTLEIEGVLFCASTLWTDYALFDRQDDNLLRAPGLMNDYDNIGLQEQRRHHLVREAMFEARDGMNDYRKIRLRRNSSTNYNKSEVPRRLLPQDMLGFHRDALVNIKNAMAEAYATYKKLVVVTHHAPSRLSLLTGEEFEDEYVYQKHDPCYASNLDYLMQGEDAPVLWIHGHTHISTAYENGKTVVVSNPKGYGNGEDTGWEIGKTAEV
jgi:predicted phosphodiesterase